MFIDGSPLEFKQAGWEASLDCSRFTNDLSVDKLLLSSRLKVVRFPSLRLQIGEYAEASKQRSLRYPISFDDKGTPLKFEEKGIGLKIRAKLIEVQDSLVTVEVFAEDVKEPKWISLHLRDDLPEVKQPIFSSRQMSPNIILPLNSWLLTGGLISDTNSIVFLMKVTKK